MNIHTKNAASSGEGIVASVGQAPIEGAETWVDEDGHRYYRWLHESREVIMRQVYQPQP